MFVELRLTNGDPIMVNILRISTLYADPSERDSCRLYMIGDTVSYRLKGDYKHNRDRIKEALEYELAD